MKIQNHLWKRTLTFLVIIIQRNDRLRCILEGKLNDVNAKLYQLLIMWVFQSLNFIKDFCLINIHVSDFVLYSFKYRKWRQNSDFLKVVVFPVTGNWIDVFIYSFTRTFYMKKRLLNNVFEAMRYLIAIRNGF